MALKEKDFKDSMERIRNKMKTFDNNEDADKYFSEEMTKAIIELIKSAEVTVSAMPGDVQVEGSPSKQANLSPLTFKGNSGAYSGGLS